MLGNQIAAPQLDSVKELKHLLAVLADPKKTSQLLEQISAGISRQEIHAQQLVERGLITDEREKYLEAKEKELEKREKSVEQREAHHKTIEVNFTDQKHKLDEMDAHVAKKSIAFEKRSKELESSLLEKHTEADSKIKAAEEMMKKAKALSSEYNEKLAKLKSVVGV